MLGTAFVFPSDIMYAFQSGPRLFFFLSTTIALIGSTLLLLLHKTPSVGINIKINWIDIILFCSLLYVILKPGNHSSPKFNDPWTISQCCLTLLYFSIKIILEYIAMWKFFGIQLMVVIFVTLTASIGFGVLQFFDILPNYNYYFTITGHFQNPARYAGYLVSLVSFAAATFFYFPRKSENMGSTHLLSLFVFSVCLTIILMSGSRSALVSITATGLLLAWFKYGKWFAGRFRMRNIMGLTFIGSVTSLFVLYQFNTRSVEGRFFIWRVCIKLIGDWPFFGVGGGNFERVYNNYQAVFYTQRSIEKEQFAHTDLVSYAYNIFLELTCEQGMIGLLLFLLLIFFVIRQFRKIEQSEGYRNWLKMGSFSGICSVITFGLFSYPFDIIPVLAIFYIYTAILSSLGSDFSVNFNRAGWAWSKVGLAVCLFAFSSFLLDYTKRQYLAYHAWMNFQTLDVKSMQPLYEELGDDTRFLVSYSTILLKERKFHSVIEILGLEKKLLAYPQLHLNLAESYCGIGEQRRAESHFKWACQMAPNRLIPKYRLFNYYCNQKDYHKAIALAHKILNTDIRIQSQRTEEIRSEGRRTLMTIQLKSNGTSKIKTNND